MFLLGEMLRHGFIDQSDYDEGVSSLDIDVPSESNDEEGSQSIMDDVKALTQSTLAYLTKHDKDELKELLEEYKDEAGEEYMDDILKLEELIDVFFGGDFIDGEPILPLIEEIMGRLEQSNIAKSSQHRLEMLLNDIKNNRYRIYSILMRLNDADGDKDRMKDVLRQLAQEDLLSEEQFAQLMELEDLTLPAVVNIIKETKVGQGLKFLPRTITGLTKKLPLLLEDLTKTGHSRVKREVDGILEELLRQGGVSLHKYQEIKDEHNIL